MAREPGSAKAVAEAPSAREVDQLKSEIASLKGQLRQTTPAKPAPKVEFSTVESELAARYQRVGGHLVSVTKRFPDRPYTAGKVYGFVETKAQLDALVASAKEAGVA